MFSVPTYLVYKIHDTELFKLAAKYFKGKLIDIGCGVKPYKELLKKIVDVHIGVDHNDTIHSKENIDLWGTAYNVPVESNYFDSALCTCVLEHLEEPSYFYRQ